MTDANQASIEFLQGEVARLEGEVATLRGALDRPVYVTAPPPVMPSMVSIGEQQIITALNGISSTLYTINETLKSLKAP